jgi:hypothetical protein
MFAKKTRIHELAMQSRQGRKEKTIVCESLRLGVLA